MRKIVVLLFGITSTLLAADDYFGINYAPLKHSGPFIKSNPKILVLNYGVALNDIFEIQGRYGFQLRDDAGFPVELDKLYGAYLLVNIPTESDWKPYGMIGFTDLYLKSSRQLSSESDLSYSIGVNYQVTENSSANIEYASYLSEGNVEVSSYSVGYKIYF